MSDLPNRFTIRVYGLLIHDQNLLLSKENIRGDFYIKLPGGGLEFGEGTIDCLKREFMEELGIKISVEQHFYTTEDFFQSAFHSKVQVMSIYYLVSSKEVHKIPLQNPNEESLLKENGDQILYWHPISHLAEEKIELPIDKIVVEKLLRQSLNH